jgi:superfamily I DNA and RNA helicase
MGENREFWNGYRATWEAFSRKLDELQAVVETGDRSRSEEALLAVEKARLAHNVARDRLAAQLSDEIATFDRKQMDEAEQHRVRQTARLLWELAGKPSGTADSDWHRAERLVRSASA